MRSCERRRVSSKAPTSVGGFRARGFDLNYACEVCVTAAHEYTIFPPPTITDPLFRLPRNGLALDLREQHRRDEPEHADCDDADEHDVDLQQLPGIPDQVADAALGGDELGRHQHDEGDGERDAQAGEDRRQCAEENDAAEHHRRARAVVPGYVPVDLLDIGGADIGVHDDGEEHRDGDEPDLGGIAEPEGEQEERHQCDLGYRKQRGDERIEEDAHRLEHRHQQANRDRRHGTDDVAYEHAVERHGDVPFEFAGSKQPDESLRDIARCRDEPAIADAQHQQYLPDRDEPDRREQVKQSLERLAAHPLRPAHACASARARLTSSSSTRQISSLSAPSSPEAESVSRSRERANGTSMIFLMRPGCAVMSTVRSPSSNASSMEWVT